MRCKPFILILGLGALVFNNAAGGQTSEGHCLAGDEANRKDAHVAEHEVGNHGGEEKGQTEETGCDKRLTEEQKKFHMVHQILSQRNEMLQKEQQKVVELEKKVDELVRMSERKKREDQETGQGKPPSQMPEGTNGEEQVRWAERVLQSFLTESGSEAKVAQARKRLEHMLSKSRPNDPGEAHTPPPSSTPLALERADEPAEETIFSREFMTQIKEEVYTMFHESFDSYMLHAYPFDELKPLSCKGKNVFGPAGYALTLIDALDTFVVLGNMSGFDFAVRKVIEDVSFDTDVNVSVFETNIRALGGLLSAHFLSVKHLAWYGGELLALAEDLGRRLLPAFNTKSGVPYGTVNLKKGVPPGETVITSAAGGGTVMLEMTLLSRALGTPEFEAAGRRATRALWERRSKLQLVGNHMNIESGAWTHQDAGIGTNIDSFYEYLIKAHLLFGDADFLPMFFECYKGIMTYLKKGAWYLDANMHNGAQGWMVFSSLASFWPGVQVLVGDIENAVQTQYSIHSLWRRFGGIPEGFNLDTGKLHSGAEGFPLRPESIESMFYLHQATKDPVWISMGLDSLAALQSINKAKCGYAATANVQTRGLADRMDSYFLAETLKYLYLLFDDDNWLRREPYVFNTEGHPLPILHEFLNGSGPLYPAHTRTWEVADEEAQAAGEDGVVEGQAEAEAEEEEGEPEVIVGACARLDYRRRIAAYGFDLISDEIAVKEEEEAAARELEQQQQKAREAEAQAAAAAAAATNAEQARSEEEQAQTEEVRRTRAQTDKQIEQNRRQIREEERERRRQEAIERRERTREEMAQRLEQQRRAREQSRQRARQAFGGGADGDRGGEGERAAAEEQESAAEQECAGGAEGGACTGGGGGEEGEEGEEGGAETLAGAEEPGDGGTAALAAQCKVMEGEGIFFPLSVPSARLLAVEQSLTPVQRFVYFSDGRCGAGHYVLGSAGAEETEPQWEERLALWERREGRRRRGQQSTAPIRGHQPAGDSSGEGLREDTVQEEAVEDEEEGGGEAGGAEESRSLEQQAESQRVARELEQIMDECQAEAEGAPGVSEGKAAVPSEECQNRYMNYLRSLGKQGGFEAEVEYLLNRDPAALAEGDGGAQGADVALGGGSRVLFSAGDGERRRARRGYVVCRFVVFKETVASFDGPKQSALKEALSELSGLQSDSFEVVRMFGGAGPRAPLKLEVLGIAANPRQSITEVASMLSQASESGELSTKLGLGGAKFSARFESPPSIVWGAGEKRNLLPGGTFDT